MGISLKPEHLKRYKDIVWLFMKYGRSDLVKHAGLEDIIADEKPAARQEGTPDAEQMAADLERMGPTFIKLGQLLSTRADLLPFNYLQALSRLQDNVEPFPYEEAERIVSSELGVRISKAFSDFDPVPIAAASLGQMHRAYLRDGRPVAVKIQRPNIRECIVEDLDALDEIAEFMDKYTELGRRYEFRKLLAEFRKSLLDELDYRQEAHNLTTLRVNLAEFDRIVVPAPVEDYTTSRVLTMDYIRGKKITSLSPLARIEIDGRELADQLFRAYLQQILVDGFFHADPHPGNVFLTEDGRVALLDLGMVARVTSSLQERLLQLLLAISEGRGNETASLALKVAETRPGFDEAGFRNQVSDLVTRHQDASIEQIDAGRVVLEVTRAAGECGLRLPREFTMIAKALLNLDQVVYTLDATFDPNAAIRDHAASIMRQRMVKSASLGSLFRTMIETKDFVEKLPGRVNKILEALANSELKVNIDAIDEKVLVEGFQKVANRIAIGLILAALIVGAAMLMRVETSFKILGYPGLAIIFFMVAAACGLMLVLSIIIQDRKDKK